MKKRRPTVFHLSIVIVFGVFSILQSLSMDDSITRLGMVAVVLYVVAVSLIVLGKKP